MGKFKVYLVTVASTVVEVEAEDGERAVEAAHEADLPYAGAFDNYEFGDWTTASELFPKSNKPEDDYEEIR